MSRCKFEAALMLVVLGVAGCAASSGGANLSGGLYGELILSSMQSGPRISLMLENMSNKPIDLAVREPNSSILNNPVSITHTIVPNHVMYSQLGAPTPKVYMSEDAITSKYTSSAYLVGFNEKKPGLEIVTIEPRETVAFPIDSIAEKVANIIGEKQTHKNVRLRAIDITCSVMRSPRDNDPKRFWSGKIDMNLKLLPTMMKKWKAELAEAK